MVPHSARVLALVAGAALAACSSEDPVVTPPAATLEALTVSVDVATPAVGEVITASALGRYSDGTERAAEVAWRSTATAVLEPVEGQPGKFTAKTVGVAQVLATAGDKSALAAVTVGPAKVTALEMIPASKTVGLGGSVKVAIVATYSDGVRETVTKDVEWTTSNQSVLLPSSTDRGYLVTFGEGAATVTASLGGQTATGSYTVTPPALDYVILTPPNARIDMMMPVQFSARGYWTDGRTEDITRTVEWTSSDPSVATIDAGGLATAVGDGSVIITARSGDVSAMVAARTITSNCPYPEDAAAGIEYGSVVPPLFWVDALDATGAPSDLLLGNVHCEQSTYSTIFFAISAGWCPYCPEYMAMVDMITPELEANGALVVYVVVETASGEPANNSQAQSLIARETTGAGHTFRVGDRDTAGGAALPFGQAVQALPGMIVVRTRDMRVIADQGRSETYLDLIGISQNPERMW